MAAIMSAANGSSGDGDGGQTSHPIDSTTAMPNFQPVSLRTAPESWNCSGVDWTTVSSVSLSGAAGGLFIILVAVLIQLFHRRKFGVKPLLIKLQLLALLSCGLTLLVYILIVLPRSDGDFLSSGACVGLGSVFYFALLSSFFWLATENVVALACARNMNFVRPVDLDILTVASVVNIGVPLMFMFILHLASNVSKPLYGSSLYIADGNFQVNRQICWIQDNTTMIVALLAPAAIVTVATMAAGLRAYVLCVKSECSQLFHLPASRTVIPLAYALTWLSAGLGNGHLQSGSDCETATGFSIAFCVLILATCLLIFRYFRHASSSLCKLTEHEQLAANSLVFIKQRPIVLGSDGVSLATNNTNVTSVVLSSAGSSSSLSLWSPGKKKARGARSDKKQATSFNDVVMSLDTLPTQFTVLPGGQAKTASLESVVKSSTRSLSLERKDADGHASGGGGKPSLAEKVLDKSRVAVDMTKGLRLNDPMVGNASLPNIDLLLRKERQVVAIQSAEAPVPQLVDDVLLDGDSALVNQSFDELESDSERQHRMSTPKQPDQPEQGVRSGALGSRRDLYSGPDGQTTPDDPPASLFAPNSSPGATFADTGVPAAQPLRKKHSFASKSSAGKRHTIERTPMTRKDSWQSSGPESSEVDTLPRTHSLPGHKRQQQQQQQHQQQPQQQPQQQQQQPQLDSRDAGSRRKRTSTRKAVQEEEDNTRASPTGYLYSHMGSLPGIDELSAQEPEPAAARIPKRRERPATVAGSHPGKASLKAVSEPNLSNPAMPSAVPASSKKGLFSSKKKSSAPRQASPLTSQDPRYWYQPGGGGGGGGPRYASPYGAYPPGYGQYPPGYGQYPGYGPPPNYGPPNYGQPNYGQYYSSPYGGLPYGYQHGGQRAPSRKAKSSAQLRASQGSARESAGDIYAEVDQPRPSKKSRQVHLPELAT